MGVDAAATLNLIGALLKYLSLAFLFPLVVALGYGEPVSPFAISAFATAASGWALERATAGKDRVGAREAYLVVALTWLLLAMFGSLPYLLAGEDALSRPIDAYFEAMSGFTTTGATVVTEIEALSRSLALWRQLTQWLGGMGIIVLAIAVLPRLRVGGRQLFHSEAPGSETLTLTASIRETARRLWLVYIGLTVILASLLAAFGATGVDPSVDTFEAVAHALTTMPTGGFSTEGRGLEAFGAATQWTVALFMVLAGANFALLYGAFLRGHFGRLVADEELRLYLVLLAGASAVLAAALIGGGMFDAGEAAFRHAVFQAVAIMTTTGYASADFNEWTGIALVTIVGLMFIGGSAGSTAGSVKVVRHLLVGRILRRELDQTVHPEIVSLVRFNRTSVQERTVRAVITFVLLYIGLFAAGAVVITISQAFAGEVVTPFEAVAAAATTVGNVGPALGFAGPMGSFAPFNDASKTTMIVLMWAGRLELIPVIVLFTRTYWRA